MRRIIFVILCLTNEVLQEVLEFPHISEMFGIKNKTKDKDGRRNLGIKKNKTYLFDLETLDSGEFKNTLNILSSEINKTTFNKEPQDIPHPYLPDTKKYMEAYRESKMNDTRRRLPRWWRTLTQWQDANAYMVTQKALDAMLTLIFMARYKLREVESHPQYNPKSVAFRLAFVYVKLLEAKKRVHEVWTQIYYERNAGILKKIQKQVYDPFLYPKSWLILHMHLANKHVNYVYVWRIVVRMHEKFCNSTHIFMTKPTTRGTIPPYSPPNVPGRPLMPLALSGQYNPFAVPVEALNTPPEGFTFPAGVRPPKRRAGVTAPADRGYG